MNIISSQIKGKGRGKLLGYPTINLEIPAGLNLAEGIWAGWVGIAGKRYKGAIHYGPIPTFAEKAKSLEVFLLDASGDELAGAENETIELTVVERLRDIMKFENSQALIAQIACDVQDVKVRLAATTIG